MHELIRTDGPTVKGSLASVAKQTGITVAEAFMSAKLVVLVDTSASMSSDDAPGGQSRYRAACNELAKLQAQNPGAVAVFSFSSVARFCPNGIPDFQQECTDVLTALRAIKKADGLLEICLISDGQPTCDEGECLAYAAKFKSRISTIFVGPEDGPGREFLQKLALASGGQHWQQSAQELGQLSATVAGLLAA